MQFVGNTREKLQKALTQEARQEILLQHSQKQVNNQEKMLEAMNKKDEGLDTAIKSMADSTIMLCNTLATTMQALASGRFLITKYGATCTAGTFTSSQTTEL